MESWDLLNSTFVEDASTLAGNFREPLKRLSKIKIILPKDPHEKGKVERAMQLLGWKRKEKLKNGGIYISQ